MSRTQYKQKNKRTISEINTGPVPAVNNQPLVVDLTIEAAQSVARQISAQRTAEKTKK